MMADRARAVPGGSSAAGERARALVERTAARVLTLIAKRWDGLGERVPVRPQHVRYPVPPRSAEAVLGKAAIAVLLVGGLGLSVGTNMVAAAAHRAPALGRPMAPGLYFPSDIVGWQRFNRPRLAAADARALARVGADRSAVRKAFGRADVVIATSVAGGALLAVVILVRPARIPVDLSGLKGTAEWASYRDVQRADLVYTPGKRGVYLGELERPRLFGIIGRAPVPLVYSGPRHVLQVAVSRSGKDVGTNTITGLATWADSIIWNDPKGEGHLQTSGAREALFGNEIVRFAPGAGPLGSTYRDAEDAEHEERFGSTCWNPLEEVAQGTDMEFSDLLQVVTMVVDPTGKALEGDNGHWYKTSRVGIKAIACKVLYDPLEPIKSLSRVADIFGGAGSATSAEHAALQRSTDGASAGSIEELLEQYLGFSASGFGSTPAWLTRTIEQLRMTAEREILLMRRRVGISTSEAECEQFESVRRRALERQIASLERELRHPDLERDLRMMLRIKGEESASVYSTINANLTPWLDPLVMRNTARCDARIVDVVNRERPVTWYNVSPINRADMMRPIIKLWYTMAHRKLVPDMDVDRASKRTISPWRHTCIWLMNERGSLGVLEIENECVPVAASYGFLFDTLVQGTGQLKEIGGDQKILEANSGVQVFHTPQDPEEQKLLSERLGNRTVLVENVSFSQGHRTRSWQTEQMPLMTASQVGLIPTEPRFKKRLDGSIVNDRDGSPIVAEPAYQLIWAPNCPPIYARKSQWFTHWRMRRLISTIPAVVPKPLRASAALSDAYALSEQVRTTPVRPESELRRKARVAEAVAMRRLTPEADLDGVPAGALHPDDAARSQAGGDAPPRRDVDERRAPARRRVVAFDERVVRKARAPQDAVPTTAFDSILSVRGPERER
jgi:type IV secretory pathway TraG/TraD family ATPase VirD4